jgi:PAS domain S-box-containing protein
MPTTPSPDTLLQAGALQAAIFNSTTVSKIATDAQGVIQIFNVGAEHMLGYTAAEVVGRFTPADLADPVEATARAQCLSTELSTPITAGFEAMTFKASRNIEDIYELTYVRKDGSRFPAEVSVTALRDAQDTIIGYLLIGSDNTARQQAKQALSDSEARLSFALETSHTGGWDLNLVDQTAHRTLEHDRIFGYDTLLPSWTYQDFLAHVIPEDRDEVNQRFQTAIDTQSGWRFDCRIRRVDGEIRWIWGTGAHQLDEWGHNRRMSGIVQDITVRKRTEEALRETNVALEAARITAEKANLAKSDFLSSMSHELRSPLNAILGFAQLLDSGSPPLTATQKESIDQVLGAGWYLLALINEILDLSLIESGKVSLSPESMALSDVLSDCQAMIEPQARKSGITLTFPEFVCPQFVKADRTRVKQVFAITCSDAGAGRVRVSFEDTGQGLCPEQMAQLFQPFNRLGQESGNEEGTGIGLVVSKRLIELMGGGIGAVSTVGVGSTFWIELDGAIAPELEPDIQGIGMAVAAAVDPLDPRQTLLCVEDNPANLLLIEKLIARRPGTRLLVAKDAEHGFEIACAQQPDVVLMDINLPGMSGLQALKILKSDLRTSHMPVIALSANAMARDVEKGLHAGFLRYLTKPIKVNEFMDTLDSAMTLAHTHAAAAALKNTDNHAEAA